VTLYGPGARQLIADEVVMQKALGIDRWHFFRAAAATAAAST